MKIVRLIDTYSDGAYYEVVTDDKSEIARLKQRGEQKGLRVEVKNADSFDAAWKFLAQL